MGEKKHETSLDSHSSEEVSFRLEREYDLNF